MPGVGGNYGIFDPNKKPPLPTSQFGNPSTFTAAANQQASDYDTIMKQYGDFVKNATTNPLTAQNVAPGNVNYKESADVAGSLANLKDLSATGGYTPQGIADIRARDIAPTRGIYANAQQNAERAKSLGGGYSPNFNVSQLQAARDESSAISGIDTAANAGIAQNVAANRLAASGTYAGASEAENAARTGVDVGNANRNAEIGTGNANRNLEAQFTNRSNILGGIQGQTNLYGTTPALTKTFGDQVIQTQQTGQGQQEIDRQRNQDVYRLAGAGG
jgi:hypothetical protein